MEISFKNFVQICGRPFLQNIFNEMPGAKSILTLKIKFKIFVSETSKQTQSQLVLDIQAIIECGFTLKRLRDMKGTLREDFALKNLF